MLRRADSVGPYVFIVPNLREDSITVICAVLSRLSGVVTRSSATNKRQTTVLLDESVTDIGVRVGGAVRGRDLRFLQPFKRRETLVVSNSRLKEVDDLLVLAVLRTVAGNVKRRVACGMLGELVAPESRVILILSNPVIVHVFKQVVLAEWLEESANVGAGVGGDRNSVRFSSGRIWRRNGIVLTSQITVLSV